ncbi:c-type cytochrome [Erythrobacter arachoides]|uniref:C-type cytochrome n=1 Tax=Aurantiacibacter arachoides TaxID=1850444 RepID=A0A844ZXP3_9SPHN|nr:c-type cytochrome [Aurantiacibacter arachoides]
MTGFPAIFRLLGGLAVCGAAGCTDPAIVEDPFDQTGELIAFSGGEAGALAACSTCHGVQGEGDGNLAPRIAGLDQGYALRQLEHFASGARKHPQMYRIATTLDGAAREKVTAYYAAMPYDPAPNGAAPGAAPDQCAGATIYHDGVPSQGVASCASCHGADGLGNAGNPPLAGQSAPYLAHQLDAWASGERYGDARAAMTAISRALHPTDRQAVAAYAARLADAGGDPALPETCLPERRPRR